MFFVIYLSEATSVTAGQKTGCSQQKQVPLCHASKLQIKSQLNKSKLITEKTIGVITKLHFSSPMLKKVLLQRTREAYRLGTQLLHAGSSLRYLTKEAKFSSILFLYSSIWPLGLCVTDILCDSGTCIS